MPLSPDECRRYHRHLLLPEVGAAGQARLRDARVLVVGVGGLGSPIALYLAAAGVGTLGVVDADVVDAGNLQRQVLHDTAGVGRLKVASAVERLAGLNPHIAIIPYPARLTEANAAALISGYDVVVDGVDNLPTRYLLNDTCAARGKPYVYGSIAEFHGQVSVFDARRGPCYRCLYPDPPEDLPPASQLGVLGVTPGIVGIVQAAEVIKLLLGLGEPLIGRLLLVDVLAMAFREVRFGRNAACGVCGSAPSITATAGRDKGNAYRD